MKPATPITWRNVARVFGLTIVCAELALAVMGKPFTIRDQLLLAIGAALLGIVRLLRNGNGGNGK